MFSLICAWTNSWSNNREAGNLDSNARIMTSLWFTGRITTGRKCGALFVPLLLPAQAGGKHSSRWWYEAHDAHDHCNGIASNSLKANNMVHLSQLLTITEYMMTLLACAWNSPVADEFPSQRPVTRSLMFYFLCAWINGWVKNDEAGDLRRHRTHYDDTVIKNLHAIFISIQKLPYRERFRYNATNLPPNTHNIDPIAHLIYGLCFTSEMFDPWSTFT